MTNISGVQKLSKETQENINGGVSNLSSCPTGCFDLFLQDIGGRFCAVRGSSGNVCFGDIINDKCCL